VKIFGLHATACQMDLIEQSKDRNKAAYPAFFHVIMTVNLKLVEVHSYRKRIRRLSRIHSIRT
jgi:hypothetical protein